MKYSLMGIKTFTTNITEDPAASFFAREFKLFSYLNFPFLSLYIVANQNKSFRASLGSIVNVVLRYQIVIILTLFHKTPVYIIMKVHVLPVRKGRIYTDFWYWPVVEYTAWIIKIINNTVKGVTWHN